MPPLDVAIVFHFSAQNFYGLFQLLLPTQSCFAATLTYKQNSLQLKLALPLVSAWQMRCSNRISYLTGHFQFSGTQSPIFVTLSGSKPRVDFFCVNSAPIISFSFGSCDYIAPPYRRNWIAVGCIFGGYHDIKKPKL